MNRLVIALLAFLTVPTLAGAEEGKLSVTFLLEGERIHFQTSGRAAVPEGAVIFLGLRFGDGPEPFVWHRARVQNGRHTAAVGPFTEKALAGEYRIEAWFVLAEQPLAVKQQFTAGRRDVDIEYREMVGKGRVRVGDAGAQDADDLAEVLQLQATLQAVEEVAAESDRVWGEEAPRGGQRLPPEAAEAWGRGVEQREVRVDAARTVFRTWAVRHLAPRHQVWVSRIDEVAARIADLDEARGSVIRLIAAIPTGGEAGPDGVLPGDEPLTRNLLASLERRIKRSEKELGRDLKDLGRQIAAARKRLEKKAAGEEEEEGEDR